MDNRIQALLDAIKKLEKELAGEIEKKEAEFYYKIIGRKVRFSAGARTEHKLLMKRVARYLSDAPLLTILTIPLIWSLLLPFLFLDLAVTIYQAVCFPVYGIPRVSRGRHIVIDRHSLSYLNIFEKFNCVYCGYVNGLISYIREIAGRTEQYWCPIKHARRVTDMHSRYGKFFEYGDAAEYRLHLERVRRDFVDIGKEAV
jgi:hypothetical protein